MRKIKFFNIISMFSGIQEICLLVDRAEGERRDRYFIDILLIL
jgi:hypothetical protein